MRSRNKEGVREGLSAEHRGAAGPSSPKKGRPDGRKIRFSPAIRIFEAL
jgi:hypothetical protein